MITLLFITAMLAWLFAYQEAREINERIEANDRTELPHGLLVVLRALVWCAAVGIAIGFGFVTWTKALATIPACAALFAIVHRLALNRARNAPWWWMGWRLEARTKAASGYDTLWHRIAWKLCGGDRTLVARSAIYPNTLPATLAIAFEAIVLIAFILLATRVP